MNLHLQHHPVSPTVNIIDVFYFTRDYGNSVGTEKQSSLKVQIGTKYKKKRKNLPNGDWKVWGEIYDTISASAFHSLHSLGNLLNRKPLDCFLLKHVIFDIHCFINELDGL